ncbi:hypothetical protein AC251_26140 (plasmid) [Ralstonia pseudosolanacearum]|uniref:hypothetical protein n=1 Tax=Ralstonia pseudosolanacearum TaxID=1310165 RepID=UPI00090C47D5|nr:hypothetical protein [Ralstonia pseudosolanacearum]API77980.1 hypothetical protein AC251_26140 [Ralstonia pseudosolanacearum]
MKRLIAMTLLACASLTCLGAQPTFRDKYNAAAKEMVPVLQTTGCDTKAVRNSATKAITECRLKMPNGLLTLDSESAKLKGVWLMLDSSQLEHPSDLVRAGGMLLRAGRGGHYGDYLAVASSLLDASRRQGWKEACVDDAQSASRFCVSSDNERVFNLILSPL